MTFLHATITEPVLVAGPVYDQYRRGENRITADGFEVRRVRFEAAAGRERLAAGTGWEVNESFAYPLFLPARPGSFGDLLIILNGLNDSSYRKFFPWAASIARSGMPVAVFPSALLMNRRPRQWISPTATQLAWESRQVFASDSASLINAVLSRRVAEDPRALLMDALRTGDDLRQLVADVSDGLLFGAGDDARIFRPGATCHFLGYSIGGYLALALRLLDSVLDRSKVIMLCAGASTSGAVGVRLDPASPFILDRHATELLLSDVDGLRSDAAQLGSLAGLLIELFTGTSAFTRQRIRELGSDLTVLAGASDRIVPARGISENLGRLDAVLPLGIHEYPFNLTAADSPAVTREIARSHRIALGMEPTFRDFLAYVFGALRGITQIERSSSAAF